MNMGADLSLFIEELSKKVTEFFDKQYSVHYDTFIDVINNSGNFLALYLGVFLIYETIKMLYGKGDQSFSGFLFTAFIKLIFILLALNAEDWVKLVFNDFKMVRDSMSNSEIDIFRQLNVFVQPSGNLFSSFINSLEATSPIQNIIYLLCTIFVIIGIGTGIFSVLKAMVTNLMSFILLMLLMPIAFFFLIFSITKQTFSQWFNMVLSNLITLLCLTTFVGMIVLPYVGLELRPFAQLHNYSGGYAEAAKTVEGLSSSPFLSAFKVIICGIMINVFTSFATAIAEKLTAVSMEGIANSTFGRAMGLAGSAAGVAGGSAALAARGTLGAGRGAVGAGKGVIKAGSMGIKGAKAAKNRIGKLIGRK